MDTTEFVRIARRMNHVNRCAGTPMNKAYTVTEHCAQAAILYVAYCKDAGDEVDSDLLTHILMHDILEVFTGDMLYPAKHLNKEAWEKCEEAVLEDVRVNKNVNLWEFDDGNFKNDHHKALWICCDATELFMRCADEYESGNMREELLQMTRVARDIVLNRNIKFFTELLSKYSPGTLCQSYS